MNVFEDYAGIEACCVRYVGDSMLIHLKQRGSGIQFTKHCCFCDLIDCGVVERKEDLNCYQVIEKGHGC